MDYLQLTKIAPSSAYAADDMNTLTILDIVNPDPFLVGNAVLFDMKKCPPALILDFFREVQGVAMAH